MDTICIGSTAADEIHWLSSMQTQSHSIRVQIDIKSLWMDFDDLGVIVYSF